MTVLKRAWLAGFCLVVALLAIAALWAAGLKPSSWWARLYAGFAPDVPAALVSTGTPEVTQSVATTAPPLSLVHERTDGSAVLTLPSLVGLPHRSANQGTTQMGSRLENPETYGDGALLQVGDAPAVSATRKLLQALAQDGRLDPEVAEESYQIVRDASKQLDRVRGTSPVLTRKQRSSINKVIETRDSRLRDLIGEQVLQQISQTLLTDASQKFEAGPMPVASGKVAGSLR